MKTINNKKMWVKVVALTLVQSFLGWNAATAAVSDRSMWQQRGKVSQLGTSMSSNSLEQETLQKSLFAEYFVPETAGTINEFWAPKGMDTQALSSSKLLIHVRDAHCNYEAQGNIAAVIDNFVKNNELAFVAVEGAEGNIDYSLLNSFPDYEVRSEVSDAFMQMGRLSGAEYANINTKQPFELFGAEKMAVYHSNLNNFRDTLTYKKEGVEFVGQIKQALNTLKENIYTPELKELEEMSSLYNNREISFVDYCQYLYNLPAAEQVRGGYKNFAFLMEAIKVQELIDFSQIDTEKTELVNELARLVPREDLTTLSQATIDFRRGKLSTAKYYETLKSLAQGAKVELASYKNLRPYMLYLNVYEQIDSAQLFQEKETLEAEIKRGLFKNLDQARLDKLSKNADVLEKLFSVRLTNADLSYFQDFRTDFTAWEFQNFIQEQAPKYNLTFNVDFSKDPIEKYLPKLEAFYMEAKTRDQILVDNTLAQMDLEGKNVAALVSGGFHTAGMTSYLRSKNIPYIVVTPRILKEDVNNPYLNLIGGELLPVEKILSGDFQFSLAVEIKNPETLKTLTTALGTNPTAAADLLAEFKKQANGSSYEIERQGQLDGVPALIFSVNGNSYLAVDSKHASFSQITAKYPELAFTSLGNTAFASAKPLKGNITKEAETAFAKKANDIVASSLNDFQTSKRGLQAFITSAVDAAKGLLTTDDEKAGLSNIQVWSGDVNTYKYPSLSQTAKLPSDQHEIINMNNQVIVSDHTIALAAARAQLGDKKAVTLLAGKLAHESLEAKLISKGIDAKTAHEQALKSVDVEALKQAGISGVSTLAALGAYLDSTKTDDKAFVDANAKLAQALKTYSEDSSEANAVAAYFAEVELRSVSTNTSVKEILAKEDQTILATALAKLTPKGVSGISAEKGLLITGFGAELGEVTGVKIPSSVFEYLKEKGVVSLMISPNVSDIKDRVAIYTQALTEAKGQSVDALINSNVTGVTASPIKVSESSNIVVVESTVATNKVAVDQMQALATIAIASADQGDQDYFISVSSDDVTTDEAKASLKLGALTVARANSKIKFVIQGKDAATLTQALSTLPEIAKQIATESEANEQIQKGAKLLRMTSQDLKASANEKVLKVEKNGRFDVYTALGAYLVTAADNNALEAYRSQIVALLVEIGMKDKVQQDSFFANPFNGNITLPTTPLDINILTYKLAIAA